MAIPKENPNVTGTKANGRSRREFLRMALAITGGALAVAGGADLGINGLQSHPYSSFSKHITTSTMSTSTAGLQPDYLDFLEWMQSVSDKVPGKSSQTSLEAEFAPYALEALDPTFYQYSQIAAGYNPVPYLVQLEEVQLAVSTKSPSYDIFSIDNQNIASFENGILSPSDLASTYPELTYPNYDVDDFVNTIWDYVAAYPPITNGTGPTTSSSTASSATTTRGTSFTLFPFDAPVQVFFYRKDIYDKLGLSVPTTWDEYFDQVQTIQSAGLNIYGCVNEANFDISIVYEYLNHLASFGGNMWNVDGNTITPNLESSECVEALENYVRFQPYADPGSHTYTWSNQFDSLAAGTSATAILWNDYYSWLNDPSRSPIAPGQFYCALNPAGPEGSFSTYGGAGLAVSAFSSRPEAAYLWIQWATCKGTQEMMALQQYHTFPSRASVLQVPQVQSDIGTTAFTGFDVAQQAWQTRTVALTPFPQWLNVLTNLSVCLNDAYTGVNTPSQALINAQNFIEQQYPNLTF